MDMSKPIEQGVSRNGHAFVRIGNHGVPLCLIDDIHFRPRPVEGLTLQGMLQVYEKYLDHHQLLYLFRSAPREFTRADSDEELEEEPEEEPEEDEGEEEALPADSEEAQHSAPSQEAVTIEREAESYMNALFDFGFPRLHLMGVGYGGVVALKIAALAPQLLRSLVVVGAGPAIPGETASRLRHLAELARAQQWRELHAGLAGELHSHSKFRGFFRAVAWSLPKLLGIPDDPERVAAMLEAYADTRLWDDLPRIKSPTLLVAGAKDPYLDRGDIEAAAGEIPGGELALWEEEGHSLMRARPEEVENRILRFLGEQE